MFGGDSLQTWLEMECLVIKYDLIWMGLAGWHREEWHNKSFSFLSPVPGIELLKPFDFLSDRSGFCYHSSHAEV
jgi:hypothetical protein